MPRTVASCRFVVHCPHAGRSRLPFAIVEGNCWPQVIRSCHLSWFGILSGATWHASAETLLIPPAAMLPRKGATYGLQHHQWPSCGTSIQVDDLPTRSHQKNAIESQEADHPLPEWHLLWPPSNIMFRAGSRDRIATGMPARDLLAHLTTTVQGLRHGGAAASSFSRCLSMPVVAGRGSVIVVHIHVGQLLSTAQGAPGAFAPTCHSSPMRGISSRPPSDAMTSSCMLMPGIIYGCSR